MRCFERKGKIEGKQGIFQNQMDKILTLKDEMIFYFLSGPANEIKPKKPLMWWERAIIF